MFKILNLKSLNFWSLEFETCLGFGFWNLIFPMRSIGRQCLLRTYARFFAEFLNEGSSERLRILSSTT